MQVSTPARKFISGTLSFTGTTAKALPGYNCGRVWLGAPTANTNGAKVNTSEVLVGTDDGNGTVVYTDRIAADGSRDGNFNVIRSDMLTIKPVTSGDVLEYRIEVV